MELELSQKIMQFYKSSMQVILESRIPDFAKACSTDGDTPTSTSGGRSEFNLYLQKSSLLIDEMEPWCRGVHEPMVIEIWYLKPKKGQSAGTLTTHGLSGIASAASGQEKPILLERWTIELVGQVTGYKEVHKGRSTCGGKHERGTKSYRPKVCSSNDAWKHAELSAVHKSIVILLRSVYSTTRWLPSQSLFRLLSTSVNCDFRVFYNISAAPSEIHESMKKDMINLCLTPVESHWGLFHVSVLYRKTVPASAQETPLLSTQIIHDYVGISASFQLKPKECRFPLPETHSLQELLLHTKMHPRSWEAVQFDLLSNEVLDCPFAIDHEHVRTRAESRILRSAKCNSGRALAIDKKDGPAASIITLLNPTTMLRDNRLHLCVSKKTVAEALKELRMYIDSKDSLRKCI